MIVCVCVRPFCLAPSSNNPRFLTLNSPPPPQVLENRTRDSKMEMEVLENLQELKELNQRQAQVDFEGMLGRYKEEERREKERQKEEDERETR